MSNDVILNQKMKCFIMKMSKWDSLKLFSDFFLIGRFLQTSPIPRSFTVNKPGFSNKICLIKKCQPVPT